MGYGTSKGSDIVGSKRYELANHLGNVLSVITDRKWAVDDGQFNTTTGIKTSSTFDGLADYYVATIVSYSDYDPFGTMQDGRKGSQNGEKYRFGYQGSEKDDEIKGEGNSYTTHYRLLDPRLGRWFSTDPVFQPWQSPYTSMDNNPIRINDVLGNYGEDRAEKIAARARKQGGSAYVYNDSGSKYGYNVHIEKNFEGRTYYAEVGGRGRLKDVNGLKNLDFLVHNGGSGYTLGMAKKASAERKAAKEREYNNEHSIMGRLMTPGARHTINWRYDPSNATSWQRTMYGFCDKSQKFVLYTALTVSTLGIGAEAYILYEGTGAVYTLVNGTWNLVRQGGTIYARNFVNGGWKSVGMEFANQTTTQLIQGGWSPADYDLLGLATSGALGGKYEALQWQMVQGASGGVATYTINDGFQSPLFQKSSNYTVCTTLIGVMSPLMGDAPIIRGIGGEVVNEVVTGATQGVVENVQPTK